MDRVLGLEEGVGAVREEIREALGRGAVVVTANERAARMLRRGYDAWFQAAGAARWEPARVMSWAAWTGSLWRRLLMEGKARSLLLNPVQEHAVWRGVLEGDEGAQGLRGLDAMAEMAAEAWRRLCLYGEAERARGGPGGTISGLVRESDGGADAAAFARWARAFEGRCRAEGLLSGAELDGRLAQAVRREELRLEERELLLVGFDAMTPVQMGLVDALRSRGIAVGEAASGVSGGTRVLTAAADNGEELRACARWTAEQIERDPGARIAVIVPDLQAERATVERVFREVLAPEMEAITSSEAGAPFEISLGRTLAETPMVAVAMELLRWVGGALPLERVSGLLVSEYVADAREERGVRAAFDAFELRQARMLRPVIGVSGLTRMVAISRRAGGLQGLLGALRRVERMAATWDGSVRSYGEWAQAMRELLAGAGWGAPGTESSAEFQARERWESALDAMATLDFDGRAVEYAEALRAIERIAGETVFAPESRAAAVQVMGPMEAAGSEFDAAWFLRAGETSWPMKPAASPLLRWGLQRELGMPGTDAERDLALARRVTERIAASGRVVVVSYARTAGEARQRASAMVRGMELEEVELGELVGAEVEREVIAVERVEDGGAMRALPEGVVSGGVRALELQAACGFRAFAEQRLWSTGLEDRALGLDARESGTAVHVALECFWTEVRSQAALLQMTREERTAALGRAIEMGLRKAAAVSVGVWDEAYLEMQTQRLHRLLESWLQTEMKRPAFAVAEREEEMGDVRIGPLRLRLRVDRVDVVDEARVLIDYKTGNARPAEWLGDRPDAPQLPLYAVLARRAQEQAGDDERGAGLGAVAFANVRAGKDMKLVGFAERDGLLAKPATMDEATFEGQVERWGEVLEGLARSFAAGEAAVDPKSYPQTCGRCGQRVLCRLDASLLEEMEDDEEREGEDG